GRTVRARRRAARRSEGQAFKGAFTLSLGFGAGRTAIGWAADCGQPPAGTQTRGRRGAAAHGRALPAYRSGARAGAQSDPARRLDQLDLLVLMLDGVEVARRTVVVALGILADGRKVSSADSR